MPRLQNGANKTHGRGGRERSLHGGRHRRGNWTGSASGRGHFRRHASGVADRWLVLGLEERALRQRHEMQVVPLDRSQLGARGESADEPTHLGGHASEAEPRRRQSHRHRWHSRRCHRATREARPRGARSAHLDTSGRCHQRRHSARLESEAPGVFFCQLVRRNRGRRCWRGSGRRWRAPRGSGLLYGPHQTERIRASQRDLRSEGGFWRAKGGCQRRRQRGQRRRRLGVQDLRGDEQSCPQAVQLLRSGARWRREKRDRRCGRSLRERWKKTCRMRRVGWRQR
mmetsp:Transcript_104405/g.294324  ORF Transcript_104405/g.294324 Transcript_104405/m.294324 type:complete len:284 (-) Transcript_104405:280-1131(-)